ncbi:sporulation protein YqfD [Pontibacillus litoralis]|uniref:Stage IV sporulation protein n=1 Tax=Pontibacillus litoralis JSM 072002 TaxID=1385512 RepID=A0A0A5GCR0_9BACI|nr:sporulation protein YqfD [Pontibacillus litoralis]KGX88915.1 hypothetical protein N784_00840 [Pontibacillus litoralis JSM 072002]
MKRLQGVFIKGYTTFIVKGSFPEFFINRCVQEGILIWNIQKVDEFSCKANIQLQDVHRLKHLRNDGSYKITFQSRIGIPFIIHSIWKRKPLWIGFLLGILLLFTLSNMVWKVEIDGVTPEVEYKIEEKLHDYGVKVGAWKFRIDTPSNMQRQLLNDVPELLWVGITEKGTVYQLQGVEKTTVEQEKEGRPQHLIAKKKGIIVDMYVESGEPQVEVNDMVQPGDVLVSGLIGKEDNQQLVQAKGKVIAETWYESEVTVPLEATYKVITGDKEEQYGVSLFGFSIPVWGFWHNGYETAYIEEKKRPLQFLDWKLPISVTTSHVWEQQLYEQQRTDQQAVQLGIEQGKQELMRQLSKDSQVVQEKILHERKENGKVKLILYFKVHENIVKPHSITQGD